MSYIENPTADGTVLLANATVSLHLLPWTNWDDVREIVKKALVKIENEPGIRYQVGPMETVMEGDLDHLMGFVARLVREAGDEYGLEVFNVAKILYRPSGQGCSLK